MCIQACETVALQRCEALYWKPRKCAGADTHTSTVFIVRYGR